MRTNWPTAAALAFAVLLASRTSAQTQVPQAAELRAAFAQAKSGSLPDDARVRLAKHPLRPWLDALAWRSGIMQSDGARVEALLAEDPDTPSSDWLVKQWRNELVRRQDWPAVAAWNTRHPDDGAASRCAVLLAVDATARDFAWRQNALAVWLNEAKAPAACTPVFDALKSAGAIDGTRAWQRFDRLLADGAVERMPEALGAMNAADASLAGRYLAFLASGSADTAWPDDTRGRRVLQQGLLALAKRDPAQAERLSASAPLAGGLSAEQRHAVLAEIALWSLVDYLPEAERRYLAVPEAARSANLREWYLRNAFHANDDGKTLTAFDQLLPAQRDEPRWQYFQARVLQRLGRNDDALPLYRKAAQSASFHGWLAAERLGADYAFCPLEPRPSPKEHVDLHRDPGLRRALWLWQLGEANTAIWEWNAAYRPLAPQQRRAALAMARDIGWYDRAVFALDADEASQRLYTVRFATPYNDAFESAAARFGIDRSWLTAHARAESVFMPEVTSGADARGLLQLLPSTAERIALRHGIAWEGPASLYRPEVNIPLGAGALRDVIDGYQGRAWLAIGAYNAGPAAVNRWLAARPALEPEFWIETVPYKETREYIPRVLAFSVIYDWRLKRPVRPITQRLSGDFGEPARTVALRCPQPVPAKKPR